MADYRWDKDTAHLPQSRRDLGNGDYVEETIRVCPVCADVDCMEHDDHPEAQSPSEMALTEAQRMAPVIAASRIVLDAWDVSEGTPPRLRMALSDLSDALARFDRIPF
jgi:hypothetical protein